MPYQEETMFELPRRARLADLPFVKAAQEAKAEIASAKASKEPKRKSKPQIKRDLGIKPPRRELLSWDDVREVTADGIRRSVQNADEPFREKLYPWFVDFCRHHCEFHTDDVTEAAMEELPPTHSYQVIGAPVAWASRLGLIEKTGERRPSRTSHGIEKTVWRSKICGL